MTYIGKTETLVKDFQIINNHFNTEHTLIHTNQSNRKDYRTYYNNRMIETISNQFIIEIYTYLIINLNSKTLRFNSKMMHIIPQLCP